jgi:hypothetical protein
MQSYHFRKWFYQCLDTKISHNNHICGLICFKLESYISTYEGVSKSFWTESIIKYTLTTINTHWEATWRIMAAKLTRLTHKIVIQLYLVAEATICSSCSRWPVWKFLDTHLCVFPRSYRSAPIMMWLIIVEGFQECNAASSLPCVYHCTFHHYACKAV